MGFIVRKVQYKDKIGFRVQYENRTKKLRVTKNITKETWASYGFSPSMSIDEARQRRDQLNAQEKLKRDTEKRLVIEQHISKERVIECALLNPIDILDFEHKYLTDISSKNISHWRTAQRIIRNLAIDPEEWFDLKHVFYKYYTKKAYSLGYVTKVNRYLNLWGQYYCRKFKKAWMSLPAPKGIDKQRIADAYFDKNESGRASLPLTMSQLNTHQLKQENYNWLYLSIWLGLRPSEVDLLLEPSSARTWYFKDGILWVYQSKLRSVPRDKRAKPIPLLRPEQLEVIKIIESRNFKRPLCKTMQNYFGPNITTYAGRKGFCDLMLSFSYRLEDISVWMGHQSIERTWKSYKNKQAFNGATISTAKDLDKT